MGNSSCVEVEQWTGEPHKFLSYDSGTDCYLVG